MVMGGEFYQLIKRGERPCIREYLVNITNGLGSFLFDGLVLVFVYQLYSEVFEYRLFDIPNSKISIFLAVFITDFVFYWSHRLGHTLPFFWAIHSVHHQGDHFNLSNAFRQPWFHKVYASFFYMILAFIGIPLDILFVAYTFNVLAQFWVHTTFFRKEICYLSWLFMTPSLHRVHHGKNELYRDRNFGLAFSLWDRLFGSFQKETQKVDYGVSDGFNSFNPLETNLYPLKQFFKNMKTSWREGQLFRYLIGIYSVQSQSDLERGAIRGNHPFCRLSYLIPQFVIIYLLSLFLISNQDLVEKNFGVFTILLGIGVLGELMKGRELILLEGLRLISFGWLVFILDERWLIVYLILNISLILAVTLKTKSTLINNRSR